MYNDHSRSRAIERPITESRRRANRQAREAYEAAPKPWTVMSRTPYAFATWAQALDEAQSTARYTGRDVEIRHSDGRFWLVHPNERWEQVAP